MTAAITPQVPGFGDGGGYEVTPQTTAQSAPGSFTSTSGGGTTWTWTAPDGSDQSAHLTDGDGDTSDYPMAGDHYIEEVDGSGYVTAVHVVTFAGPVGWFLLDLPSGTSLYASMFGGGTDWSHPATIQVAQVHGYIDATADCGVRYVDIGAVAGRCLDVRLDCGDAPENPSPANSSLGIVVFPATPLASTEGFHTAITKNTSGFNRGSTVNRVGSGNTATGTAMGSTDLQALLSVAFVNEGTTSDGATARCSSSVTRRYTATELVSGGTFTTVKLGLYVTQQGTSPTVTLNWPDVAVWYRWSS